jgi:hypothetical protein
MRRTSAAIAIIVSGLTAMAWTLASAGELYRPPVHVERGAFEACMFSAWVEDYCASSYPFSSLASAWVRACVIANGGGKFPIARPYIWDVEDYCRIAVGNLHR